MKLLRQLTVCGIVAMTGSFSNSFAQTHSEGPASTGATQAVAATLPKSDPVAARFVNTCAGCHSLTGAKLTGPELSHVAVWPEAQLTAAIKRMEAKVGPQSDMDIAALARFLKATDVRERIALETERIRSQFAAKLEVGSPTRGKALFQGREPMANGGLSCASCHQVEGKGGRLGPDLTGVYKKMGELPLMSSLDKVGFKIMAAHYQRHPVTRQEAVHLVAYLKMLDAAAVSAPPPRDLTAVMGTGLAAVGFIGLVVYGRQGQVRRSRKLEYRKH